MISYISGKLQYKDNGFVIIDTAGGGWIQSFYLR